MPDKPQRLEFPVIENFSPEVLIEVYGILKKTIKVVATVDTGSTGFLQIPLATGIKANLRLIGTRYYTMADGRKVKKIECMGQIRFAGQELFGIISLSETSDDCLLGMQFLEALGMDFTVSPKNNKAIFQSLSIEEPPTEEPPTEKKE